MSKFINCNVSGTPSDIPVIFDDAGGRWNGVFNSQQTRCTFTLPDSAVGGGHLRWQDEQVNFLLPLNPGAYEGASLGLPTIAYESALGLRILNGNFITPDGEIFLMKGATEFNLPAKLRAGENVVSTIRQRKSAGANLLRSLSMGYPFRSDPQPLDLGMAESFWRICADEGMYLLWCVFAGTRTVMPDPRRQQEYWEATKARAAAHPNVLLQLANEWNHSSQSIDPSKFARPSANLGDHGPGQTDASPVAPPWDCASWHARRDSNAKGFTNYDCYEFEADPWPKRFPMFPGEGAKPEDYGFDPEYARQQGKHCGINWGGIFHTNEGVRSDPWPPTVQSCAAAFYQAVDGQKGKATASIGAMWPLAIETQDAGRV